MMFITVLTIAFTAIAISQTVADFSDVNRHFVIKLRPDYNYAIYRVDRKDTAITQVLLKTGKYFPLTDIKYKMGKTQIEFISDDIIIVEKSDLIRNNDTMYCYNTYYPDGRILTTGQWNNRQKAGIWTFYDMDGKVFRRELYDEGVIITDTYNDEPQYDSIVRKYIKRR